MLFSHSAGKGQRRARGFWAGLENTPSNHLSALGNWSWWVLGPCSEVWEAKGEGLSSSSLVTDCVLHESWVTIHLASHD